MPKYIVEAKSKEDLYEYAIEMAQKDAKEERAYMQNEYQRSQGIF